MGRIKYWSLVVGLEVWGALILLGSCMDSAVDIVKAATIEVMKAHDRYLKVLKISPDANEQGVNPGCRIRVVFDRPLDMESVSSSTVEVTKGNYEAVIWSGTFDVKTNTLDIKPQSLLTEASSYYVTLRGIKGTDGSSLLSEISWSFTTGVGPSGQVKVKSSNLESTDGFTNTTGVQITISSPNSLAQEFTVAGTADALSNPETNAASWTWKQITETWNFTLAGQEEGRQYVYVILRRPEPLQYSAILIGDIVYDKTAPSAPTVSGITPTNNKKPTWTWSSGGGGGSGVYRYQLDSTSGSWTQTTALSFSPSTDLTDGSHILYVQERDAAGNWSNSGSKTVVVDTVPPSAPTVSGITPTNNKKPTWTWSSGGGGGSGVYRYQLDSTSGSWTQTTALSFSPSTDLTDGSHILYVQERDAAGNWSNSGSKTVVVDTVPPSAPTVSGITPTNNKKPTWTWSSGGGGNGQFRYYLYAPLTPEGYSAWSSGTSYTPSTDLADGTYTVGVQEKDEAGNLSSMTLKSISVNGVPNPPVFTGPDTVTLSQTPTWSWQSGGFGIGVFRYYWNGSWSADTTATSYTPSTLADGTYTLEVKEKDANGDWSSTSSRTVVVTSVIPYDGQTYVSTFNLTLKWRGIAVGYTYTIQIYDNSSSSWISLGSTTNTYYPVDFTSNTLYCWRVKATKVGTVTYIPSETGAKFWTGK